VRGCAWGVVLHGRVSGVTANTKFYHEAECGRHFTAAEERLRRACQLIAGLTRNQSPLFLTPPRHHQEQHHADNGGNPEIAVFPKAELQPSCTVLNRRREAGSNAATPASVFPERLGDEHGRVTPLK